MKNKSKKIIIMVMLLLSCSHELFAAESIGFTISCTIPAIPGVNAPLAEEKALKLDTPDTQTQEASPANENEEKDPALIEEMQEIRLAGETTPPLIKTVYSR